MIIEMQSSDIKMPICSLNCLCIKAPRSYESHLTLAVLSEIKFAHVCSLTPETTMKNGCKPATMLLVKPGFISVFSGTEVAIWHV